MASASAVSLVLKALQTHDSNPTLQGMYVCMFIIRVLNSMHVYMYVAFEGLQTHDSNPTLQGMYVCMYVYYMRFEFYACVCIHV